MVKPQYCHCHWFTPSSASVSLARLWVCAWVYWTTSLVTKKTDFWMKSLSHPSHLKIVLGSVTVPMAAFLIFHFSTCRMFRVCSACLIPSFTRCRHMERSLIIISQLSMSMAADFISSCKYLWSEGVGSQFYMYPQAQSSRGLESFIFPSCICVPAI